MRLPLKQRNIVFVLVAIAFFIFLPRFLNSAYYLHIAILTLFFGFLASAWNILGGYTGQPSFGHALFVGSGAYASALLFLHLGVSPWIGMWLGGAVAGCMGLIVGYLSFRYGLRGHFFLLVTIAFAYFFEVIVVNTMALGAAAGFRIPIKGHAPLLFQFGEKIYYYYIIVAMVFAIVWLCYSVKNSKLGYYFLAIRDNEDSAQALGVAVMNYKLISITLSAFLSGMGGAFYAQYMIFIEPRSLFGIGLSAELVIYAIVGGVGSVFGPMIGALILYPVSEYIRAVLGGGTPGVHLIVYGLLLMVVIVFMPEGLAGLWRRLMEVKRFASLVVGYQGQAETVQR